MTYRILIFLPILILQISCSTSGRGSVDIAVRDKIESQFPSDVLKFPPSSYFSMTLLSDGNILVSNPDNEYFFFDPSNVSVKEIIFPKDPTCTLWTRYLFPSVLPTNDVGFVKECLKDGVRDSIRTVVSIDLTNMEVVNLVEEPLPSIGGSSFSWNPQNTMGVQEAGSIFRTIYLLTPEKAEPLDIQIHGWSLAQNYHDMLSRRSNDNLGLARAPHWSPDGQTIAFLASTEAIGRSGQQRLKSKYGLYLMKGNDLQPDLILDNIYYPADLNWDPTNTYIAFTGDLNRRNNPGLWILEVSTMQITQVSISEISVFSWALDGQSIVALRQCSEEGCLNQDEMTENLWSQYNLETCTSQDIVCREVVRIDVSKLYDRSLETD